jgi:hypothetical protein
MSRSPHERAGPRIRTHSLPPAALTLAPLRRLICGATVCRSDPIRSAIGGTGMLGAVSKHHQAPVGKRSGWPCNRPGIDQFGPWGPPGAKNSLAPLGPPEPRPKLRYTLGSFHPGSQVFTQSRWRSRRLFFLFWLFAFG